METLSDVGIPMADVLAEHLGSHVVILVVGPVGSEKGEVCLRTYVSICICFTQDFANGIYLQYFL